MTVVSSNIAAGVAQTTLQAQQVARERDNHATQAAAAARRMRDLLETHMRALEEGDEFESPAQLHIDNQLPDQPSPDYPEHERPQGKGKRKDGQGEPNLAATDRDALYRHLDVQA